MTQDTDRLIERVEAADGPDRELDCAIAVAQGFITRANKGCPDKIDYGYVDSDGNEVWPKHGFARLVSDYTASIDAAMTLVPEGESFAFMSVKDVFHAGLGSDDSGNAIWYASAATPALALCAAALKARKQ